MLSKRRIYKAFKKLGYHLIKIKRNTKGFIFLKRLEKTGSTIISVNLENKKLEKYFYDSYDCTHYYSRSFEYEELKLILELLKKEGWFNEKE